MANGKKKIVQPKPTTFDLLGGILCKFCNTALPDKINFEKHYKNQHTDEYNVDSTIYYKCTSCPTEYDSYIRLRTHCYLKHVIKDKFKCEECNKQFSKAKALRIHIENQHKFTCPPPCNKSFKSKRELTVHKILHKKEPQPSCFKCNKVLCNLDTCTQHIDLHATYIYSCPICAHDSPTKTEAIQHLKVHFPDKDVEITVTTDSIIPEESAIDLVGIACLHCEDLFSNRKEFDTHYRDDHDGVITYSCPMCDKPFTKYRLFDNHCYEHSRRHRFECELCSETFSRLSLLVLHSRAAHPSEEALPDPLSCPECDKKFHHIYNSRAHLREAHNIHHGYKCKHTGCGKLFDSPKDLVSHERVHSYNDNWCRQCSLVFTSINACANHLEMHKKINYSCPVCSKMYAEKYLILKHSARHFETSINICKVCGKSFNARYRLSEHVKVHNASQKFTCPKCGKSFLKQHTLDEHVNIHFEVKPYECSVCTRTFTSYPNFRKHMIKMHNIQPKKKYDLMAAFKRSIVTPNEIKAFEKVYNEVVDSKMPCKESDINSNVTEEVEKPGSVDILSGDMNQLDDIVLPDDFIKTNSGDEDLVYSIVTDDNLGFIDLNSVERQTQVFEESTLESNFTEVVPITDQIIDCSDVPVPVFKEIPPTPPAWSAEIPIEYSNNPLPVYSTQIPLVPDVPCELAADIPLEVAADIPREYGPDFSTYAVSNIDDVLVTLDEHATLPHIDPKHITIENNSAPYIQNEQNLDAPKLDKCKFPMFKKVYPEPYEDIGDVINGALPMWRQDILH